MDSPPPITRRIDLNVGYSCNMRCHFCYYQKDVRARRRDRDLTTDQCKRLMAYHRCCGMDVLELTGGEPTIRKDLLELIDYARRTVRFRAVSIITNGVRLADPVFAREVVQAGVSDFLFSLQGSTEAMHDGVTGLAGSFRRLLKALENLLSAGAKVRCNSVITGENLPDVRDRAALLGHLGVPIVNFILFNPIEQADEADKKNFLHYTEAARPLREVIQTHGPALRKLTIRYMPFCVMPDCLPHLQNIHQVHYDHDEWNYYQRAKVREPRWKWLAGVAYGMAVLPGKRIWRRRGSEQYRHAAILEADSRLKKLRPPACRRCRFGFICGGVWRRYARRFGDGELTAQEGKLLLDPWHFMPAAHRATPPWLQPSPPPSPQKSPTA